ncbi:hypothetical protein [Aeromonas veronii]|uniref:hypothetical protein n=1 Tax=Aeromonas veronii TaxID=654 RepID=UPI003BA0D505
MAGSVTAIVRLRLPANRTYELAAPIEEIPLAAQLLLGMPLLLAWRYQRRNQGRLQPANGQLAPAICMEMVFT